MKNNIEKFFLVILGIRISTFFIATSSIFILALSFYLEYIYEDLFLFQRSGSIVVLLGAYASYRQITHSIADSIDGKDTETSLLIINNATAIINRSKVLEMGLILVGTLIWGYGDFLVLYLI